jgi:X-X-X-Leu-X-X-Gly heptad repeat protein
MRPGVVCALTVGICLALAANASAATLCVPNVSIPGCPSGSANEPTIQAAADNANPHDTILIGPDSANGGPYKESVTDNGKPLNFIGAGPTKTLIQAQGSPGMNISPGSKVSNLGIQVHPAGGNTGLQLAGKATNVSITAQAGVTYCVGVALVGGTFRRGTVSLPVNVSEPSGFAGVVGNGTVADSAITASVGVGDDASAQTPNVTRDRIRANQGVLTGPSSTPFVEDSLIRTVSGPSPEIGVANSSQALYGNFVIRHTTIVGSGTPGSTGVAAAAYGAVSPASTSVVVDSTIVRGYASSITATAQASPFSANTTVTVEHTFYDPARSHTFPSGSSAQAQINRDSHSGNHNPLFVSPAAGNFQLRAGSPAIDDGSAKLASGESTTDLAGHRRRIVGRKGDARISDVGAYEFRPTCRACTCPRRI